MNEELKPCPFGTHHRQKLKMYHRKCRWYESGLYAVMCEVCGICGPYALSEKRAIERWNARTERTCRLICHGSLANMPSFVCWSCSECGFGWHHSENDKQFSFCPNCGARVIGTETVE